MMRLGMALAKRAGMKMGRKIGGKVGGYLHENKRRNDAAAAQMDKKYPGGWAQSPTNMTEFNQIKKSLKNATSTASSTYGTK